MKLFFLVLWAGTMAIGPAIASPLPILEPPFLSDETKLTQSKTVWSMRDRQDRSFATTESSFTSSPTTAELLAMAEDDQRSPSVAAALTPEPGCCILFGAGLVVLGVPVLSVTRRRLA